MQFCCNLVLQRLEMHSCLISFKLWASDARKQSVVSGYYVTYVFASFCVLFTENLIEICVQCLLKFKITWTMNCILEFVYSKSSRPLLWIFIIQDIGPITGLHFDIIKTPFISKRKHYRHFIYFGTTKMDFFHDFLIHHFVQRKWYCNKYKF